jgi:hypothetical protein
VFILEHYFIFKSFAAVCEAFSSADHDKEAKNKTGTTVFLEDNQYRMAPVSSVSIHSL